MKTKKNKQTEDESALLYPVTLLAIEMLDLLGEQGGRTGASGKSPKIPP